MKEDILMRVLMCKIQCPLICFCKPSAAHLYTCGPLKLENNAHFVSDDASDNLKKEEGSVNGKHEAEKVLKSCIRKPPCVAEAKKKRVQWKDNLGKELAQIKEFESSETGDTDTEEENGRCLCVIL